MGDGWRWEHRLMLQPFSVGYTDGYVIGLVGVETSVYSTSR